MEKCVLFIEKCCEKEKKQIKKAHSEDWFGMRRICYAARANKGLLGNGYVKAFVAAANGNTVVDDNHVHNAGEDHHRLFKFDQLYGGAGNARYCNYGVATHPGVTVVYPTQP